MCDIIMLARSHCQVVPEKVAKYSSTFANPEHLEMWDISLFTPLKRMLTENNNSIPEVLKEAGILESIDQLRDIYLNKKEVLLLSQ